MSRFDSAMLQRAMSAVASAGRAAVGPPPPAPSARSDSDSSATPTTGQAIAQAAALCRRFEGFRSRPYLCPAGVPTIGYGSTRYADGTLVRLTDPPITADQAEALLLASLRTTYLPALRRACPAIDTPGRLASLIDWTYNLGEGNLRASTLRRRVNAGDWAAVPAELRRWVRGGGRVLPGLVARRGAESALV